MNKNQTIGGGGFHHVATKVADFERAIQFYTEGLGFTIKITWGEGDRRAAMLDAGSGDYLEVFAGGSAETASEARLLHFALRTSDCAAAHARALAFGATERMPPKSVTINALQGPIPVTISFVISPTGEVIEFFENALGQS
jgi:glyoxylase I family protein